MRSSCRSCAAAFPLIAAAILALPAGAAGAAAGVDPWVLDQLVLEPSGESEFLIVLAEQADLSGAAALPTKLAKGQYVFERLRETAARTQVLLLDELARAGVVHRPFWIANLIWAKGDAGVIASIASHPDVAGIAANPSVAMEPARRVGDSATESPDAIEWNITRVNAPAVWALGYTGQGAVIAGQDTGYQWDHPALKAQYRGWNGATADHNFDWHDAIHSGGIPSCVANATAPCDDNNHGTHTMGTMVGDDGGANQIGMAPGAKWIGCRNMDSGDGTPVTYTECWQWFLAPTDLAGGNADPALAPDVINNSWGCPTSEGCDTNAINAMQLVVESVRAAGNLPVASAGNSGSRGCSSVSTPAAIYDAVFTVANTTSTDTPASNSSRGPVTVDFSNRRKPDIAAPGTNVRSSLPGGGYASFSGTSMAGPHVAGLVALLISAEPGLAGNVDRIEELIRESAFHPATSNEVCGGISAANFPNNTFGFGRIDALAAVNLLLDGLLFRDGFGSGLTDDWSATVP